MEKSFIRLLLLFRLLLLLLLLEVMEVMGTAEDRDTHGADVRRSFCNSEFFTAQCDRHDTVILMAEATYGRMTKDSGCVKSDFGYLGCANDVLGWVDLLCSGRRACSFKVLDETFPRVAPCHEDLKSYLQAKYTCVPVVSPKGRPCQPTVRRESSGFFASLISAETRCGSEDAPWLMEVPRGQRINVTLFDFGTAADNQTIISTAMKEGSQFCNVYASLLEVETGRNERVCRGHTRISTAYISHSNKLEIRIINTRGAANHPSHFLLHYKAIGCPDVEPPTGAAMSRNEAFVQITCSDTADSWRLQCMDGQWIGPRKNCTPAQNIETETTTAAGRAGFTALPLGISVIIIVALALAIGLLVLAVGVVCLKRVRHGQGNEAGKMYPRGSAPATSTVRGECYNHEPSQKHTVVCALRNTQTATLLHSHRPVAAPGAAPRAYGGKDNDYSSMQLLSGLSSNDPSLDGEFDGDAGRARESIPLGPWCCECPYGVAGNVSDGATTTTTLISKPLRSNVPMYTLATTGSNTSARSYITAQGTGMMCSEIPDITSQVHDGKAGTNEEENSPEVGQIIDLGDSVKTNCDCSAAPKSYVAAGYEGREEERTCQQCGVVERLPSKVSYSTDPLSLSNNTFTGKRIA